MQVTNFGTLRAVQDRMYFVKEFRTFAFSPQKLEVPRRFRDESIIKSRSAQDPWSTEEIERKCRV